MRIQANLGIQNSIFNAQSINQKVGSSQMAAGKNPEDQAKISPLGKASSMVEMLKKQKESLMERKKSLVEQAAESGNSVAGFQEQMKEIEKQMEALDEQIMQAMAKEMEESTKKQAEEQEKPMTREDVQTARLNSIISAVSGVDQMETIQSVQNQEEGRVNVLEVEIKSGYGDTEGKIKEAAELKAHSSQLSEELGKRANDISKDLSEEQDLVKAPEDEIQTFAETQKAVEKQEIDENQEIDEK